MAAPGRPGKTAPRLVYDLLSYDPANPPSSHFNLLKDAPPVYQDSSSYPELISRRCCKHSYVVKPNQTRAFPQDGPPIAGEVYQVASTCLECRRHMELSITYKGQVSSHARNHLHHLVYSPGYTKNRRPENPFKEKRQQQESYCFECTYPACSVLVMVIFLSPTLGSDAVALLTDENLLKQRHNEALKAEPERLEGLSRPLPTTVLSNLRTYLENALHDKQRRPAIKPTTKRFVNSFGIGGLPCAELFTFLGFAYKEEDGSWIPPEPDTSAAKPYRKPLSIFLDNVSTELTCLISQRPQHERTTDLEASTLQSANPHLCQLLGALNYNQTRLQSYPDVVTRPPYYEDLGAMDDMSNDLIVEAYNRQVASDPEKAPYYLRCLQSIGEWRGDMGGTEIVQAVSYEYSNGRYADSDVSEAYNYFQLDYRDQTLNEDAIIGSFFARIRDAPDDMEPRRQLWRIGDWLKNEKIKAVAEERVSTVEQALVFLGCDKDTGDDFIISMYTAKVNDSPFSKDLAKRAVELIAESRKSQALQYFLNTGDAEGGEMDAGEAFQLLQIPDRTVDDTAILAAYSVCCSEAPGQADTYRKALSVIAKERQSALLSSVLDESSAQEPARALADWPVGLNNIGNTCYLNSLLQFYFTITPFRNMVLDFENYKAELNVESIQDKRIGSRKVSAAEIERSQKFIRELRSLFHSMITSPSSAVTPEQELARLTLLSSTGEAAIRRKSLVAANRPGLGEINGMPVQGPLGPPAAEPSEGANPAEKVSPTEPAVPTSDADAESTPVSAPTPVSSELDTRMEGVETTPPNPDKADDEPKGEAVGSQQPQGNAPVQGETSNDQAPTPPDRPPPVPPRPVTQVDRQQQIKEEVELGAQQDVTEVINNVLFQAQCAIKPRRVEADGESVDLITDQFYGKTRSYLAAQKETRSKDDLWADIKVDVASGSRNMYSALDGAFDAQIVDVEGESAEQHGAITKLPPVLQIQVQRVQFDQVQKRSFKSTHHLELQETIYLDRYMDAPATDDLHGRRREKWKWKDELRTLQERKDELLDIENSETLPETFRKIRERLEALRSVGGDEEDTKDLIDIDESVINDLTDLEEMTKNEITSIEAREKDLEGFIESQFADMRQIPYHLYAVFMHHGSVTFGHYYIYIFDFVRGIWRKYNDGYVTEVHNTSEIFGPYADARNPPTPYFVVYVHDRMRERVAQPVCRDVVEETETESENMASQIKPGATPPTPPPRPSRAPPLPARDVEMKEVPAAAQHDEKERKMSLASASGMPSSQPAGSNAASSMSAPPPPHHPSPPGDNGGSWNSGFADHRGAEW